MLEFILDFVFDLILEGTMVAISEKKVPMPIRVIAFIIFAFLYLGIAGLLLYIGWSALVDKEYIATIIFLVGGIFILIAGFVQIRKELIKRNED